MAADVTVSGTCVTYIHELCFRPVRTVRPTKWRRGPKDRKRCSQSKTPSVQAAVTEPHVALIHTLDATPPRDPVSAASGRRTRRGADPGSGKQARLRAGGGPSGMRPLCPVLVAKCEHVRPRTQRRGLRGSRAHGCPPCGLGSGVSEPTNRNKPRSACGENKKALCRLKNTSRRGCGGPRGASRLPRVAGRALGPQRELVLTPGSPLPARPCRACAPGVISFLYLMKALGYLFESRPPKLTEQAGLGKCSSPENHTEIMSVFPRQEEAFLRHRRSG